MTLWRRKWQPTPVFLPGKSHRQRSLAGYSPRGGHKVSDTTELLNNNIKYQNEINYLLCSHVKGYLEDSANNHSMIKFYHNIFKKYFLLKIRRTLEGKR